MDKRWYVLEQQAASGKRLTVESVVDTLLKNRGIEDQETFFEPPKPEQLLAKLPRYFSDLDQNHLAKAVKRIKAAIRKR